jgi:hypothetical protein
MSRRYNRWAGNPKGDREDPTQCVVEVSAGFLFKQCGRKRGKGKNGDLCAQHAKQEAKGGYLDIPKVPA